MATYDVTGPSTAGARPGRFSAGIRTPYLVENVIDVSAINSDAGAAQNDVLQVLDIPAETLVLHAGIEVLNELSSCVTLDLDINGRDGETVVEGDANANGYSAITNTSRPIIARADQQELVVINSASEEDEMRVFALLCDVSGVDETDRNSATQHDG